MTGNVMKWRKRRTSKAIVDDYGSCEDFDVVVVATGDDVAVDDDAVDDDDDGHAHRARRGGALQTREGGPGHGDPVYVCALTVVCVCI